MNTQALSNNNQGYLKLLHGISIKAQHQVVHVNTIKTEIAELRYFNSSPWQRFCPFCIEYTDKHTLNIGVKPVDTMINAELKLR